MEIGVLKIINNCEQTKGDVKIKMIYAKVCGIYDESLH